MKFTLIVRPDGRALLTTTERIPIATMESIRKRFADWEAGKTGVALVPECDVIQVSELTIDVGPAEGGS